MMEFKDVSFIYDPTAKDGVKALDGISLTIEDHEFLGLLGHTGSGKSTLVQHMNALNLPSSGQVTIYGLDTRGTKSQVRKIRQEVGLVFQYPEDQLFEPTIYKDIAFGPRNLKLEEAEIDRRVRRAMEAVGLDFNTMKDRSPFELSGGQKRRVAIAGVLALEPRYLVLDEPTAGLDPQGRKEILDEIHRIYEANPSMSIILVTHSMEDVAAYANRLVVLDRGKIVMDGSPEEVFSREEDLEAIGLALPQVTKLMRTLRSKGMDVDPTALTVDQAFQSLKSYLEARRPEVPSAMKGGHHE
ncbi:energy-coupling factor transporter ATPase [Kallipyga massiliensis]|uniref:energy-coupling factor transporter ATPase n=1 Tax=Kallipyga massiliensis TaxID=1472764 RepID=UPI0004AD92C0|nr:energy-coupling factor transporter ATPase [Kallipyga massiliensis]